MGLNIDELLKLDRLRDTKVEGTGVKRVVEICRDESKILKETEEHIYETVEVVDGAFVKEKGIIDEIVRMTFYDEEYERSLNNHYRRGKEKKELYGFYLRYKNTNESHPFNLLFRKSEKAYMNTFKRNDGNKSREEFFEEDHRSQARMLAFEILAGANLKFNKTFRKTFNLDITNINDFKIILLDTKLAKDVVNYIVRSVGTRSINIAEKGRNADYVVRSTTKKGESVRTKKQIGVLYLDNKTEDGNNYYDFFNDDEYVEELHVLDSNKESEEAVLKSSIYAYINKNSYSVLTDKQIEFFNACVEGRGDLYISQYHSKYKKNITNSITTFLDNNKNINVVNNRYEIKNIDLIDAITDVLDKDNNQNRFFALIKYLELDNNVSDNLIHIIYNLKLEYRQKLTLYLLDKDKDKDNIEKYIDKEFIHILNALNKQLNFMLKTSREIYLFNKEQKEETEDKIKRWIENNIFKNDTEIGSIFRKELDDYVTMNDVLLFLNSVLDRKIKRSQVREILLDCGYEMEDNPKTIIKGIRRFKVFRKHS